MNKGFKKDIQGKKSKFYSLEQSISQRKMIMDHPQEEDDPIEGEDEAADAEDSPRMTKMKKRENLLTSQRLSATIFRRWVTLPTSVIQIQRRKENRRRLMSQRKPKRNRL